MKNNHTCRILVDLDETIFPFAHAYHAWLERETGRGLVWDGLNDYDLDAATQGRGHDTLAERFLLDESTLEVGPIPEAAEVLRGLAAGGAEIWVVTARFAAKEADATRAWVHRHIPEAADRLLITRTFPGGPKLAKPAIAWSMGAHALIDDYHANFDELPSFTKGLLIRRPDGLPSDASPSPEIIETVWSEVPGLLAG